MTLRVTDRMQPLKIEVFDEDVHDDDDSMVPLHTIEHAHTRRYTMTTAWSFNKHTCVLVVHVHTWRLHADEREHSQKKKKYAHSTVKRERERERERERARERERERLAERERIERERRQKSTHTVHTRPRNGEHFGLSGREA